MAPPVLKAAIQPRPFATTRRQVLCAGAAGALAGCTLSPDANHDGPDTPRAQALARPPRVAWVLGSGGPRGFVHVGVLKALEELGLQPDLIVGASVGALVGTLRAGGLPARQVESLALSLNPLSMASMAVGVDERFSGAPMASWLREQLPQRLLEHQAVPMACVALRRRDAALVHFNCGDAGLAVQASAAIEGQFAPVRLRGELYVDPDLHAPLPVRVARALGAQRVLAVDASAHESRAPAGAERFRESDLRKRALTQADARLADLVLHPDFGYWVSLSHEFRQRAMDAGYRQALAQAAALKVLHAA